MSHNHSVDVRYAGELQQSTAPPVMSTAVDTLLQRYMVKCFPLNY